MGYATANPSICEIFVKTVTNCRQWLGVPSNCNIMFGCRISTCWKATFSDISTKMFPFIFLSAKEKGLINLLQETARQIFTFSLYLICSWRKWWFIRSVYAYKVNDIEEMNSKIRYMKCSWNWCFDVAAYLEHKIHCLSASNGNRKEIK